MPINLLCAATMLLASSPAVQGSSTKPFVSPMFSSDMVLQRDMRDPVWGWTDPGSKVTVSINGQIAEATADKDGEWMTRIGPFKAGGPYTLTVSGPSNASFEDVLVGDVWICSGQSNMEFGVGNLIDPDSVTSQADNPNLRLYFQPKMIAAAPMAFTSGNWMTCTPDHLKTDGDWGGFSAVAYFFGKKLQEDLKVPIGLIHTSWGGTPAQAWTCEKDLADKLPEFRGQLAQMAAEQEAKLHPNPNAPDPIAEWYRKNDPGSAADAWAAQNLNDSDWKTLKAPSFFQDAGYPELVNQMSVVWYRREVTIDDDPAGKAATLSFMADDNDAAFVNGVKVGVTDGYNIQRSYKVPSGVLKQGQNEVAIRVTDTQAPGGVWGDAAKLFLQVEGGQPISLAGEWKVKLGTPITAKNMLPSTSAVDQNSPTVLYNGMIQPIIPFGIKGAIWYQGESNAGQAYQYRTLLPTMIESWRRNWRQGDFPFYIVQLAGFGHPPAQPGNDAWAELREAQWLTAVHLRNTGIATAMDIGDENDIHPKNKQEMGRRLALAAEAKTYREQVPYSGPVYKSMKIEGNSIRLWFDHLDGGLVVQGDTLKGFAIAGADRKWHWADAKIDGGTVVVSSTDVPNPVAVRYAWATYLTSTLYNKAGLPAFSFRTDDWPEVTGGPKK